MTQLLIKPYIDKLRKHEVVKVGISLGLDSGKLGDVGEDKIHGRMVERWLGKQDYVKKISMVIQQCFTNVPSPLVATWPQPQASLDEEIGQ